jgi:tRNA 2-thiouridine synthesizing protein A
MEDAKDETSILDLRGLKCPLPALLAKKALAKAVPGAALTILADDPLAAVDIPHMCHGEGHAVESVTEAESHRVFAIRRGPDDPAADGRPPKGG